MTIDREGWADLPVRHAEFLETALETLREIPGISGVAAGGSFVTNEIDELSDLDLVVAVEPDAWPGMLSRRMEIAAGLGPLLAGFTGEHVGEPRLLICLYGPPLLHIDLKFVSLDDVHDRVEDPTILWERNGRLTAAHARADARYPDPDPKWIEDRFWIWMHYLSDKIERGELLQAVDSLAFLRGRVLGPLALQREDERPDGVRRIETRARETALRMRRTVAELDALSCLRALEATIELYEDLRPLDPDDVDADGPTVSDVEREVRRYVAGLERRLMDAPADPKSL